MSQKEAAIIEKAVVYLEKHEMELDIDMKTIYHDELRVTIELSTGEAIRISNRKGAVRGAVHRYNLILGLKEVEKITHEGKDHYYFPMRLIDGLVAKISYDNKVRKGEVKNETNTR